MIFAARSVSSTPNAERVVAEIKLGNVAILATAIDAFHSVFEDREEAFDRVGMHVAATTLLRNASQFHACDGT